MAAKGNFIVFEGIDGSGTTTQAALLHKAFVERERGALLTCEPTDGAIGKLIRDVLKKGSHNKLEPDSLALLFAADRIEHYRKTIRPALEKGNYVISDRYVYSSLSYQPIFSELGFIEQMNSEVPFADVCFILRISVDEAIKRISAASRGGELFEKKEILTKVSENYDKLAERYPGGGLVYLDGELSVEEVHKAVLSEISTRFGLTF
ncbi:MAG: dTMP kinase [Myxococcota bacterium]